MTSWTPPSTCGTWGHLSNGVLTIRKLSPATTKAYQADLAAVTRLLPPHDGPWMVDELAVPVLRTAFAAFAADHAPASVARARSTWTTLFDLLVADDHLDGSPMAAVPRTKQAPRAPKPLLGWDKDTVERLIASVMSGKRSGRTVWLEPVRAGRPAAPAP